MYCNTCYLLIKLVLTIEPDYIYTLFRKKQTPKNNKMKVKITLPEYAQKMKQN